MIRARLMSVLFLVSAAALAQPCGLTAPGFARIDGISGEATDQCHKNEVQLLAPVTAGGSTVTLVKGQDAASAALALAAATGRHIREVTITTFNPSNMNAIVVHKLQDVVVSLLEMRAGNVNREDVTLAFAKIETSQFPGSVTSATTAGSGALPAQMTVGQSSSMNLSSFRFTIRGGGGGRAEVSSVVNPAPAEFPENSNVQIRAGRMTWYLIGAKPTVASPRAATIPGSRTSTPRGETALQFASFRIVSAATGNSPLIDFSWDLSQSKKV